MPVYNGAATIELALNSLVAQTYDNWECVIVNDGSTDGTRAILDSLTDNRFKVIHLEKNMGRGAARQEALCNAQGDYLAYLDADDFYHSQKLEKQVEAFEANPDVVLVSCGVASYNKALELISTKTPKTSEVLQYALGDIINFAPPSSMIKLEVAKSVRYEKLSVAEDTRYFSLCLDGKSYYKLEQILYYYFEAGTTYSKIIQYQYGVFVISIKDISGNCVGECLKSIREFAKLLTKMVVIPIMGVEKFIARRGSKPSPLDVSIFTRELNNISNK